MRYNRASINDTIRVAKKVSQNKGVAFVVATGNGFLIQDRPADFNRRCYRVTPTEVTIVGTK